MISARQRGVIRETPERSYGRRVTATFVRGEGAFLFDSKGRRFIDMICGAGALPLGHNHDAYSRVLADACRSKPPLQMLDFDTRPKAKFLRALSAVVPSLMRSGYTAQFTGPTGADAVEASLKLARVATGRRRIVGFSGSYHGMTAGALSVSGFKEFVPRVSRADSNVVILKYGGICGTLRKPRVDGLRRVGTPAAIIVECVQGEGGVISADQDWLRMVRSVATEVGALLIVDEVQTGMGRTGTIFSFERYSVVPDIVVMSKAIGGGLPLGLILHKDSIPPLRVGEHAGTFRGNQLAMLTGAATIDWIAKKDLHRRAESVGRRFQLLLRDAVARYAVREVRGAGLMIGMELVCVDSNCSCRKKGQTCQFSLRLVQECGRNGLLVEMGGNGGRVIRFLPPLDIDETVLEDVVDRLAAAFSRLVAHNRRVRT